MFVRKVTEQAKVHFVSLAVLKAKLALNSDAPKAARPLALALGNIRNHNGKDNYEQRNT